MSDIALRHLYHRLATALGPSGWWPADSPYEILCGAILVQNTNWQNVDRSLANLRTATNFEPQRLRALPVDKLQALIRPSGFFVNKSRALAALFTWLSDRPLSTFAGDATLRTRLLALPGIGPETADTMRLFVFNQPTFVADHYARLLWTRLGQPRLTYPQLKAQTTSVADWSLADAQEFHGLIDNFGKTVKTQADFDASCLAGFLL